MMEKVTYNPICEIKLNENKYMVISDCSKGGYTIGQKVTVKDGSNSIDMFMKGAIHINDIDTMKDLRDKIDHIIEKFEKSWKNLKKVFTNPKYYDKITLSNK